MAGEHGYFSERGRILHLEFALASRDALINEQQEKIDLLMQPVPAHGDFPWQMVRLWVLNYTREKQQWRAQVVERDGRIARLEEVLRKAEHELEAVSPDPGSAFGEVLQVITEALDDKGEG